MANRKPSFENTGSLLGSLAGLLYAVQGLGKGILTLLIYTAVPDRGVAFAVLNGTWGLKFLVVLPRGWGAAFERFPHWVQGVVMGGATLVMAGAIVGSPLLNVWTVIIAFSVARSIQDVFLDGWVNRVVRKPNYSSAENKMEIGSYAGELLVVLVGLLGVSMGWAHAVMAVIAVVVVLMMRKVFRRSWATGPELEAVYDRPYGMVNLSAEGPVLLLVIVLLFCEVLTFTSHSLNQVCEMWGVDVMTLVSLELAAILAGVFYASRKYSRTGWWQLAFWGNVGVALVLALGAFCMASLGWMGAVALVFGAFCFGVAFLATLTAVRRRVGKIDPTRRLAFWFLPVCLSGAIFPVLGQLAFKNAGWDLSTIWIVAMIGQAVPLTALYFLPSGYKKTRD